MVKNKTILGVLNSAIGFGIDCQCGKLSLQERCTLGYRTNHADWLYQTGEKATGRSTIL